MLPTGLLAGASSHVGIVITGNRIRNDFYGVYVDGLVPATLGGNHFRHVHAQVKFT